MLKYSKLLANKKNTTHQSKKLLKLINELIFLRKTDETKQHIPNANEWFHIAKAREYTETVISKKI